MRQWIIDAVVRGEGGHAQPWAGIVAAMAGAIVLGIGAANDTGWLAITGGVLMALGLPIAAVLDHRYVDADLYAKIDTIEGKK